MRDLYTCRYANTYPALNVIIKILSLDSIEGSIYDYIYRAAHLIFAYDSVEQLLAEIVVHHLRLIFEILINLIFSQQGKCNVIIGSAHTLKDSSSDGLVGITELQLRSNLVFLFDLPSSYVLNTSLDREVISDN